MSVWSAINTIQRSDTVTDLSILESLQASTHHPPVNLFPTNTSQSGESIPINVRSSVPMYSMSVDNAERPIRSRANRIMRQECPITGIITSNGRAGAGHGGQDPKLKRKSEFQSRRYYFGVCRHLRSRLQRRVSVDPSKCDLPAVHFQEKSYSLVFYIFNRWNAYLNVDSQTHALC